MLTIYFGLAAKVLLMEGGSRRMAHGLATQRFLMDSRLNEAVQGDVSAYFDLGMAYATGATGIEIDLVEAHKWFNLAALGGIDQAQQCRAEISEDMTAREIAEAQRQARTWLQMTTRQAA